MRERRRRPRANDTTVIEVPITLIRESEKLRLRDEPYPQIDQLAADIEKHGQTTPMFVRAFWQEPDYYELIAGNRRFRALLKLGATTALVRVFDLDDEAAYDLALSENQYRGALTEIERARACLRLADSGKTQAEIAERMGWSADRVVRRYLKLARDTTPPLSEKLQRRAISLRSALVFLTYAKELPEDRQRQILDHVAKSDMSSKELETWLRQECTAGPEGPTAPPPARPRVPEEPLKKLKHGGFVLRTLRLDVRQPSGVHRGIDVLRKALRRARRLEKRLAQAASDAPTPIAEEHSE